MSTEEEMKDAEQYARDKACQSLIEIGHQLIDDLENKDKIKDKKINMDLFMSVIQALPFHKMSERISLYVVKLIKDGTITHTVK